jgi:Protein of unknown function (DUF3891)
MMIVNITAQGWEVIYQPAHALLASSLAHHWKHSERSNFWVDVLAAITQHDSQQSGEVSLTEMGTPRGFTVSSGESDVESLEQPRQAIREALYQSRYVALLTSAHITTIYSPKRSNSKNLDLFLREQKQLQGVWRKSLGVRARQVKHDYDLVHWCDRCSLILCQDELPSAERRLEIAKGPSGARYYLWQRANGSVGVEPWPFEEDEFSVSVEMRRLEQASFADEHELGEALGRAKVTQKKWVIVKH